MTGQKPREIAARLLQQRENGEFIETLLERAFARGQWSPEDRRFLQELVYGVTRWQLTLDWLISQKSAGRPQKPLVQNLLRLALYQMFWLDRVPSYAAVNETVEICKGAGLQAQAKFINAVLRGYDRESAATRQRLEAYRKTSLSLGFSHPEWLCRRWEERWGKAKTVQLLEWNNSPPPVYVRINRLKTDPARLFELWTQEGVKYQPFECDWAPRNTLLKLEAHPPLATLPSFRDGLFYVQDPSTLLAVSLLEPKPGDNILDLCAAPGGKTAAIADAIQNSGRILAEDLDPARLKRVTENCTRLGATCVLTDSAAFTAPFNRILADVPCSNTGVMRRRVELRWRIRPEEIQRLAKAQLAILESAAARLARGGTLVYSTCSLEPEENASVTRQFLKSRPEFRLELDRTLTPVENGVDGAYAAVLTKPEPHRPGDTPN